MNKAIRIVVFWIVILAAAYFLMNALQCFGDPEQVDVPDTWTKPMTEAGYKPADPSKPDHDPGGKIEFIESTGSTPVLYASGMTEDSTVVEFIGAISPDGTRWLQAWADGQRVELSILDWFEPQHDPKKSDWSAIAEVAWVSDGLDIGLGAAWQPLEFRGIRGGLCLTVDVNEHITAPPDWIAVCGRLSVPIKGHVEIAIESGYRFGENSGTHLAGGIGVRF